LQPCGLRWDASSSRSTAVGGFLGANLAGLVGALVVSKHTAAAVQPWVHGGWCFGTAVAFFGAVTGRMRFINGTSQQSTRPAGERANAAGPTSTGLWQESPTFRERVKGGLVLGLIGGFLGAMLGGSLLMFWFSLAYSPFAPKSWVSSVKVERDDSRGAVPRRHLHTTNHPVALGLFGVPVLIGATAGSLAGFAFVRPTPAAGRRR
jgi:uncharacterized membrane protein YeaQ/YmgE (transglycosylase-associated protein family)